jgi:hypothetical protein
MAIIAYVVAAAALFWLGMILASFGGLIFVLLAAVLAGLKVAGIVAWSWWWVMLPLWTAVGGAFVKMRMATRDPEF